MSKTREYLNHRKKKDEEDKYVLGKLGPYASKLLIKGQWIITETNIYLNEKMRKEDNGF